MTRKTVKILAAITIGLVILLTALRINDRHEDETGQPLLTGFDAIANELHEVRVLQAEDGEAVTIRRKDDRWVVVERDGYAADLATLRQLVVALTEAKTVEQKTANPALYEKLGVDDPEDGGTGTKVVVKGPETRIAVVLGDVAQGERRYARIADAETSYLIDRNPELPSTAGDWLRPDIVDIDAAAVRRVTVSHADGERIVIEKTDREQANFDVADIPEGRELSYASVGDGLAGGLSDLTLDDVRAAVDAPVSTTVEFETWDELMVTAAVLKSEDDSHWLTFVAESEDERSADINARLGGWQYRLVEHKQNLLTRRWDDLLKPVGNDE